MARWTRWGSVAAAADLLSLSGPIWCHGDITAEYTQVRWQPGTVSSGAYAWYAKVWIYPANNSAINYHYYGLECKGVRYAHQTIYPDHTFSFGSEDIIAEQYLYMSTSNSCSDQIPGNPEFVIYH